MIYYSFTKVDEKLCLVKLFRSPSLPHSPTGVTECWWLNSVNQCAFILWWWSRFMRIPMPTTMQSQQLLIDNHIGEHDEAQLLPMRWKGVAGDCWHQPPALTPFRGYHRLLFLDLGLDLGHPCASWDGPLAKITHGLGRHLGLLSQGTTD